MKAKNSCFAKKKLHVSALIGHHQVLPKRAYELLHRERNACRWWDLNIPRV